MTFLVERTGARISCLLNPEALEARRTAGVVRRRGAGGAVLGMPRTDDPLVATGGGVTEYDLRLLFDVDVANEGRALRPTAVVAQIPPPPEQGVTPPPPEGPEAPAPEALAGSLPPEPGVDGPPAAPPPDPGPPPVLDVRSLTQPLWALAETGDTVDGLVAPQLMRMIWGKSWNVLGVVIAVAERLEQFDANGVPQRSWLSMRLRRVEETAATSGPPRAPTTPQFETAPGGPPEGHDEDVIDIPVDPDGYATERHDLIAHQQYGDPTLGPAICEHNGADDLLRFQEGTRLRIPRRSALPQVA